MPKKRLPGIANSAEWERVTKGRAGIRWRNVVDEVWKELGVNQEDMLSMEKFGGYKTKVSKCQKEGEASVKKGGRIRACLILRHQAGSTCSRARWQQRDLLLQRERGLNGNTTG